MAGVFIQVLFSTSKFTLLLKFLKILRNIRIVSGPSLRAPLNVSAFVQGLALLETPRFTLLK